jgi:hypothetical protein
MISSLEVRVLWGIEVVRTPGRRQRRHREVGSEGSPRQSSGPEEHEPPTRLGSLAETPSVFAEFDEWLRRRLRQVRWKEWTRPAARSATSSPSASLPAWPISGRTAGRGTGGFRGPLPSTGRCRTPLGRSRSCGLGRSRPASSGTMANRRMRTRTSGGVGGGGVTPPPTRFPRLSVGRTPSRSWMDRCTG